MVTLPFAGCVKPVTEGAPSKLSAVAPLVPVSTLNAIAASSLVVTASAVMSATAPTVNTTLAVSVPMPSLLVMLSVAGPL